MKKRISIIGKKYRREKARREERKLKTRLKKINPKSQISLETRDILNKERTSINYTRTKKYSRSVNVSLDYNTFQYLAIVRRFIQKKYEISIRELELMLFLYPIGLWSRKDFGQFPHDLYSRHVEIFVGKGFAENIIKEHSPGNEVYRLTRKAKSIVRNFYETLNGDKLIPENPINNPLFKGNVTRSEMKVAELIAKLNKKREGREEKTKQHIKLEKRIDAYKAKKRKQREYERINALQIRIKEEREKREQERKEKEEKLKEMKNTLSSYLPE